MNTKSAGEEDVQGDDAAWQALVQIIELGDFEKVLKICHDISTKKTFWSPCTYCATAPLNISDISLNSIFDVF